jgi:hypothetical protein
MNLKKITLILLISLAGLILLFGGYAQWNSANPEKTCASCHEISPSVNIWMGSAHRNIRCTACHGTALSNGIHSLKEKANMVFTHVATKKQAEEIKITETQVLEISSKCAGCHQSEFAKWQSGGHSARYADIFMNGKHNLDEAPYWACLRCHGMFYDGNIKTLLQKPDTKDGVWKLTDVNKMMDPTMPCLTCHSIHAENELLGNPIRLDVPKEISYGRPARNRSISWYIRADNRYIRAEKLMKMAMFNHGQAVKVSDDPASKLCMQCHSPNFSHQTGSQDDRTPTGVHEGISCTACHAPHSNDARNSCSNCHPALSNCGLDVTKMNTTFASVNSPNNIHSVSCNDCHSAKELENFRKK